MCVCRSLGLVGCVVECWCACGGRGVGLVWDMAGLRGGGHAYTLGGLVVFVRVFGELRGILIGPVVR